MSYSSKMNQYTKSCGEYTCQKGRIPGALLYWLKIVAIDYINGYLIIWCLNLKEYTLLILLWYMKSTIYKKLHLYSPHLRLLQVVAVHSWISMILLSKTLRWPPPSHPHELYEWSNKFTFVPYTSLTHVLRVTEESIPLVDIRPLIFFKLSS